MMSCFYLAYSFLYCYFFSGMVLLNYAKVSVAADSRQQKMAALLLGCY
jgi:hypothetical protein